MGFSRRDFIKLSSVTATGIAAGGLTLFGCTEKFKKGTILIPHASHWGPFNAVVQAGKLIGIQPLNDIDSMPTKMLMEGLISRVYHQTRVKYPMVRKSYLKNKGGDTKPHLRGKDPFVRVSWEVALALCGEAIIDTIEKHGNEALFSASYGGWSHAGILRPQVLQGRLFGLIGGHTSTIGDYSGGASQCSLPHILGDMEVYSPQTSWEVIAENTEVFVLIGSDPWKTNRVEYRVADHQMYQHWKDLKEKGIQFISIDPIHTPTNKVLDAEWIKIIPNTDTALFLSLSHYVYTKGKYDKKYLDKYTVGFDKFLPYLLGKDPDGSPEKTPEWASKITGIPSKKIIELAELFLNKRTQFAVGWSLQRADHGEMSHWAIVNFAAMIGKIGKPGEGIGFSFHYGNGGTAQSGKSMPVGLSQGLNPVSTRCPASRIAEMLLNPGEKYKRDGIEYIYADVKLLYTAGNNFMSHQQNTNELISALNKKIETIICQDPWWCASSRFADIVLPATTTLERNGITSGGTYSNDKIYAMRQVIEPVGESLDDFEIFKRLGDIMGVGDAFSEGKSIMDIIQNSYEKSDGKLSFKEFWDKGVAKLDVPEDARQWVRHGAFYTDPVKNPLHTKSGKIELYSEEIAEFECKECPPIPKFLEPIEYLGNAKQGQFHVLSPHPYMRLHSQMANSDIRKDQNIKGRQHVLINTEDAKNHNIKDGDLIELSNSRGALIAGARVTDRIMTGVLSLEEGSWLQLDSKGRCNSGSINIITTSKACSDLSQATSANSCLATLKICTDPESENKAYEPPKIESIGIAIDMVAMDLTKRFMSLKIASADLPPGGHLFYNKCTLCHGPKDPESLTKKQWHGVTESMFPRAGLTKEEKNQVLQYLEENAKDSKK